MPKLSDQFWTSADKAVAAISELLALLFGLPFGEDIYHGLPISAWHWFFFIVAVLFAGAGPMWPLIRKLPWVSERFSARIMAAAIDPVNWIFVLILIFFFVNGPGFVLQRSFGPKPIDRSHRVIVNIPLDTLFGFYKGRLEIEGDRLIAPYLGKWINISGPIDDIRGPSFAGFGSSITILNPE